jgi:hypothetical protein
MAKPVYTSITPRGGGLVHAVTLKAPFHTACGIRWEGWLIGPKELTCTACEAALYTTKQHGLKKGKGKR